MDPTQDLLQLLGGMGPQPSDPLSRLLASGFEQHFPGGGAATARQRPTQHQDPILSLLSILMRARAHQDTLKHQRTQEALAAAKEERQERQRQEALALQDARLDQAEARAERSEQHQRAQSLLTFGGGLLKHDNPAVREAGGMAMLQGATAMGLPPQPELVQALATRRVPVKDIDAIRAKISYGWTDPELTAAFPSVSSALLEDLRARPLSDAEALALGAKTGRDVERQKWEDQIKEAQATDAILPPHIRDVVRKAPPDLFMLMGSQHRIQTGGKELRDGTPESLDAAYRSASSALEAQKLRVEKEKAQVAVEKALTIAAEKQALKAGGPRSPAETNQVLKTLSGPRAQLKLIQNADLVERLVDRIPADAFPQEGDSWLAWLSQRKAALVRATRYTNNEDLRNFLTIWPGFEVGMVSRGFYDEKNAARAKVAYETQLQYVDRLPPKSAVKNYLSVIKDAVREDLGEHLAQLRGINAPPDVIAAVEEMLTKSGTPVSPLTPQEWKRSRSTP